MKAEFVSAAVNNPAMKAYFLADGLEQPATGYLVRCNTGFHGIHSLDLVDQNVKPAKTVHTITGAQVDNFFSFFGVGMAYTAATYRKVKASAVWQAVYGVRGVTFQKEHKTHGLMISEEEAIACRVCRLVLPLRTITIDHQKAQEGGATAALIRVFRGFGLTRYAPTGKKNIQAVATYASQVGGDPNPTIGDRAGRYTLNEPGAIYYTVFRDSGKLDDLKNSCMNHYLNLRPVCGPCNSSLSNMNVF